MLRPLNCYPAPPPPPNASYFYRPQRSWAKVIFSQACVKNSVHRGGRVSASVHAGIPPPRTRHTPLPRPGTHPPGTRHTPPPQSRPPPETRHTPPGSRLQHTVNERPVRILLECILVTSHLLIISTTCWTHSLSFQFLLCCWNHFVTLVFTGSVSIIISTTTVLPRNHHYN